MKIEVLQCESCTIRVDNFYAAKGWLEVKGDISVSYKESRVIKVRATESYPKHFCSEKCLLKSLKVDK